MNDVHPPTPCSSCREPLAFIEYGTKIGKNGKPAKWPIYEKCKNPGCKAGRKNAGIPEVIDEVITRPMKEPVSHTSNTRLCQLTNRVNPPIIFDDIWDSLGSQPGKVQMHQIDIEKIFNICQGSQTVQAIKVDTELVLKSGSRHVTITPASWNVTRGYGYFAVVTS